MPSTLARPTIGRIVSHDQAAGPKVRQGLRSINFSVRGGCLDWLISGIGCNRNGQCFSLMSSTHIRITLLGLTIATIGLGFASWMIRDSTERGLPASDRSPSAAAAAALPILRFADLPPRMQEALANHSWQTVKNFDSAKLATVERLGLTHCGVTDQHLPYLKHCPRLIVLFLDECPGLSNLHVLAGHARLQKLILNGCTGLHTLDSLAPLPSLQELYLEGCTGLTSVAGLPPTLTFIDFSGCTSLTSVEALAGLTTLRRLLLTSCRGLTGLKALPPNLTQLWVNDCTPELRAAAQRLGAVRKGLNIVL